MQMQLTYRLARPQPRTAQVLRLPRHALRRLPLDLPSVRHIRHSVTKIRRTAETNHRQLRQPWKKDVRSAGLHIDDWTHRHRAVADTDHDGSHVDGVRQKETLSAVRIRPHDAVSDISDMLDCARLRVLVYAIHTDGRDLSDAMTGDPCCADDHEADVRLPVPVRDRRRIDIDELQLHHDVSEQACKLQARARPVRLRQHS